MSAAAATVAATATKAAAAAEPAPKPPRSVAAAEAAEAAEAVVASTEAAEASATLVTAAEPAEAVVGTVIGRAWHRRRTDSRALRDGRWTLGSRLAHNPRCLRSLHARHSRCRRSRHGLAPRGRPGLEACTGASGAGSCIGAWGLTCTGAWGLTCTGAEGQTGTGDVHWCGLRRNADGRRRPGEMPRRRRPRHVAAAGANKADARGGDPGMCSGKGLTGAGGPTGIGKGSGTMTGSRCARLAPAARPGPAEEPECGGAAGGGAGICAFAGGGAATGACG